MGDIKNILYSFVPLLLIIAASWFFSFLGSKLRKPDQQATASNTNKEEQNIDIFQEYFGKAEPEAEKNKPIWNAGPSGEFGIPQKSIPGSPTISSKPINPKWWGA